MPKTSSDTPNEDSQNREQATRKWSAKTLFVIALIGGGIWLFLQIADWANRDKAPAFDDWALMSMRNPDDLSDPIGPDWFQVMARDATALGGVGFLTLLTILTIIYLCLRKRYRLAILVAIGISSGILASTLLKASYSRPRPELVPHNTMVSSSSFPSGHSMMSAIVFLTLGALLANMRDERALKAFFISTAIFLTLIVGLSRMYLGVHYPTDVFAGWLAGAVWATFFVALSRSLKLT